jgi:hypothetical protein
VGAGGKLRSFSRFPVFCRLSSGRDESSCLVSSAVFFSRVAWFRRESRARIRVSGGVIPRRVSNSRPDVFQSNDPWSSACLPSFCFSPRFRRTPAM